ncbi:hypothetical protein DRO50_00780, partial [Candidatus Bathyarchaeota archaeon]
LVEERVIPRLPVKPESEEARMVQGVLQALQKQLPVFTPRAQLTLPKIILFLTESEYESLGIDFDVNQVYEVELTEQSIKFRKVS